MNIKTEFVRPPIPIKCFDWEAWDADTFDADVDYCSPIGYGATEQEAIDDLKQKLNE